MDYEAKRSVHEVNGACARNGFGKFHFRGVHEGHRRLWIFLILGVVLELLGLGLGGLYLHVRSLTSSLTNTEILPTYVSVASVSKLNNSPIRCFDMFIFAFSAKLIYS